MKPWHYLGLLTLVIVGGIFGFREPLAMSYLASKAPAISLEEHKEFIGDSIELRLPQEGAAPFPVILQFHGCAGIRRPFHHQWADVANEAGYAAMIVDSMGPRNIVWDEALETVCEGEKLLGQERATDVLAAIKIAEDDPRLDTSQMVLAAWSHGAWTVMDYLTMNMENRRPAGLSDKSVEVTTPKGAIFFYPYCGVGTLSRFRGWTQSPSILAFVAGEDVVVDSEQCTKMFERKKSQDYPLDYIVYPDAQHVFDDPFLEAEWIHWYNEEYFLDAKERYENFLKQNAKALDQ